MIDRRPAALLTAMFLLFVGCISSDAASRSFNICLYHPWQLYPEQDSITGLRVNIGYGLNEELTGLDIGLVNHLANQLGENYGYQFGIANNCYGMISGGGQIGAVNLARDDVIGFQAGLANYVDLELRGAEFGIYNSAKRVTGTQIGVVSRTGILKGFQLGIYNVADELDGVQIGFLNVANNKKSFKVLPFINAAW